MLFSRHCPHCRSVEFRGVGARNAFEKAVHWILLPFLARAYKFKEIGDYGIGEGAKVTDQDAANLIDAAAYFVLGVTAMIGGRKGSHG